MGHTWELLGGDNTVKAASGSDEPKVEELPNGNIVLSCRKSYGRIFNIWNWSSLPTKENPLGSGAWGTAAQSNQQTGGISVGSNSCNGEILYVECLTASGQPAKLMLQSLPSGNDRSGVEIWFKDITNASAYSSVNTFSSNWTRGLRVSPQSPDAFSAYSTMCVQQDGKIGFFYEEGPATYCMVYVPLSIEKITNGAYKSVELSLPTAEYIEAVGAMKAAYTDKASASLGDGWTDYVASDKEALEAALAAVAPLMEKSAIELLNEPVSIETMEAYTNALQAISIVQKSKKGCFVRIKGYSNIYISGNAISGGANAAMSSAEDSSTIFYLAPTGELINLANGRGLTTTHSVAEVGAALNQYTVKAGQQAGKYSIVSNATGIGTYLYDNSANGKKLDRNTNPVTSGNYNTDWTLTEVTTLPITLSAIDGRGYATFYTPVAISDIQGAKAYIGTKGDGKVTFTEISSIPAGTAAVLFTPDGATSASLSVGSANASTDGNILQGTVPSITCSALENLTMQNGPEGIGFYKYSGTTLAGFKAYIPASSVQDVKSIIFDFGQETFIGSINEASTSTSIYNLQGQKLNATSAKTQKGIFITHGKKVVMK